MGPNSLADNLSLPADPAKRYGAHHLDHWLWTQLPTLDATVLSECGQEDLMSGRLPDAIRPLQLRTSLQLSDERQMTTEMIDRMTWMT
jgi:hypothetical protein